MEKPAAYCLCEITPLSSRDARSIFGIAASGGLPKTLPRNQACSKPLIVRQLIFRETRRRLSDIPQEEAMRLATLLFLVLLIASPTTNLFSGSPQQRDVPAEVESAKRALEGARNDLQHAGGEWGGHRANAMQHIDMALKELNEAEKFAREHHEMK